MSPLKQKGKRKEVKAWASVYRLEPKDEWTIDRFFARRFSEGFYSIFATKKEALEYAEEGLIHGISKSKAVPVKITYYV